MSLWYKCAAVIAVLAICGSSAALTAEGDGSDPAGDDVLDHYLSASQVQQSVMRGASMEVDIDASIPKLETRGKLHALRHISKLGQITYKMLGFTGDNTIKKEVISRYLAAEQQSRDSGQIAIIPANYKFKYKGVDQIDGKKIHVFQLNPKKKIVGLFKGELWIDAATFLPVRDSGRFVKNPSVFFKKVDFVREYQVQNGLSIPKRMETTVDTRILGKIEMSINFTNFSLEDRDEDVSAVVTRDTP